MTALNTHKLTPPEEGGGMDQPGGGGTSEVPGGATGYLRNQRGRSYCSSREIATESRREIPACPCS